MVLRQTALQKIALKKTTLQQATQHYPTFFYSYSKATLKIAGVILLMFASICFANDFNQFYSQLEPQELVLAESVILKSIETQPTNYKLQSDLGFIQYYLNNTDAALQTFQTLSTIEDLQNKADVFYGLALVQNELKQQPESLVNIIKAYDLSPERYEIVKLYADISHTMNLHKATVETHHKTENVNVALPEVTTENNDSIAYTFKNALNAYKENNIEAARQQLEALLGDNPDDTDAMVLLAFIMYREGNSIEAEKIFTELANRENFDDNSDVLYGLALAQRNLGKEVEAFENILRAIVAETTREDLLALYRSLALQLSASTSANQENTEITSTTPNSHSEADSALTLNDVIADVTKSENLNSTQ